MEKQVYQIDSNGIYIKPIIIDDGAEIASDIVEIPPPQGLYRARWTGTEWIEDMPQVEIDALNNQPQEPTDKERIAQLEQIIDTMLMGGIAE